MSGEDQALWGMVKDFASLPATEDSRSALLAVAPLPVIAALLSDAAKAEIVCRCITKLVGGGVDELGCAILSSAEGVGMLQEGMLHWNSVVRTATIGLVKGMVSRADGLACLISNRLLASVGNALQDGELSVSNAASGALIQAAGQGGGALTAVFDECGPGLERIMLLEQDAEKQLRGLELVARLWTAGGEEGAKRCRKTCAKRRLEELLGSDDVLLQLNAVEILSLLPSVDVDGLMPRLLATAEEVTGGAVSSRLMDCVARFLAEQRGSGKMGEGSIAWRLCALLGDRLQSSKGDELVDAVSALSSLVYTPAGLCALAQSPDYARIMGCLPDMVRSMLQSLRLAALCALGRAAASLAQVQQGDIPDINDRGGCLGRAGSSLAPFLFQLSQSPIQEERIAALFTLKGVCSHGWGLQAVACVNGFLQHILDRGAETTKLSLEEKFGVAKAAASHPKIGDMIGPEAASVLMAFVREGPFVISTGGQNGGTRPQVATQKAS